MSMTTYAPMPPLLYTEPPISYADDRELDDTPGSSDGYRPGACNIGPEEIAMRRRAGVVGLGVAAVAAVALVATGVPHAARVLVGLPLGAGAVGILQARFRFCAGFGLRGVRNFGALGSTSQVEDSAARAADRRRAFQIGAASAAIGLAGGIALALLPV